MLKNTMRKIKNVIKCKIKVSKLNSLVPNFNFVLRKLGFTKSKKNGKVF